MQISKTESHRIIRCRTLSAPFAFAALLAASAGAQESMTTTSANLPACPPQAGGAPLAAPAPGMAATTGATGRTDTGTGMTATFGATPPADTAARRGASATAGNASSTTVGVGTPAGNNSATNPDNRFSGLNTTNGANGTGVTPRRTSTMTMADGRVVACVIVPSSAAERGTPTTSGGDVQMPATTPNSAPKSPR